MVALKAGLGYYRQKFLAIAGRGMPNESQGSF